MLNARDFLDEDRDFLRDALGGYADWFGFNGDGPVTELVQASTTSGTALLLTDRATLSGCFPDAFLFPVRWEKREQHAGCLPAGILAQADMVLAAYGDAARGWKLAALDASLAGVDLSNMPIGGNSGSASLAASLFVAMRKTAVTPAVFASAGWEQGQLCRVEGLDTKVPLLAKLATAARPVLYVHRDNQTEAARFADDRVEVRAFPTVSTKAAQSLASQITPMLYALGQLPTAALGASLEDRLAAFNADGWPSDVERFEYYDHDIARDYTEILRAGKAFGGDVFLVLYNPGNPSLARVMIGLVGANRVVVLRQHGKTDDDDRKELRKLNDMMTALEIPLEKDDVFSVAPSLSPQAGRELVDRVVQSLSRHGNCLYVDAQNATSLLRALSFSVASQLRAVPLGIEQVWAGRTLLSASSAMLQDFSFVWR